MNASDSRHPDPSLAQLLSRWAPWLAVALAAIWLGRTLRRGFWSLLGVAMGMYWMFHG